MEPVSILRNPCPQGITEAFGDFDADTAARVRSYHRTFPGYAPTPLADLKALAEAFGVGGIYVKDESYRFGLNAFKSLGGSYAIGRQLAQKAGRSDNELSYTGLLADAAEPMTFVTATDGNHGRGVAWAASVIGQKSVVYMPKGTAPERLANIRRLGSDASITEFDYDTCVATARKAAEDNGWILVQDTAWPGYETIPRWIMQGYLTMTSEALEQMNGVFPTHIFLQAGVGSMAAAAAAYFTLTAPEGRKPTIIIVEPHAANCLYETARQNNGQLVSVPSESTTIMAGLNCGTPSTLAWEILSACTDFFVSMSDRFAADGMRILGNPLPGDPRVISGESGASCFGLAADLLRLPAYKDAREQLGLGSESRILCFSTEGDTDRENYRRIVWDGKYV